MERFNNVTATTSFTSVVQMYFFNLASEYPNSWIHRASHSVSREPVGDTFDWKLLLQTGPVTVDLNRLTPNSSWPLVIWQQRVSG